MIFFAILVACSLLISDSAQLESYKHDYENFSFPRNKKIVAVDYDCETFCKCPQGPPNGSTDQDIDIFSGSTLSKPKEKYTSDKFPKRTDVTSPQEIEAVYVEQLAERWT
ncbi:uncharacterized protein LOC124530112 isoform X2 [Vanessa cardui]|uniref:uncharacterized protein LOC124530112 isoform X2 n=1 Tax=Vanessa cardui TaxID=171605 RepID=UPI001F145C6E|nr:uncharacterized protein LOC124530112 isoform X2 [Vanessa cardui]